MVDLGPWVGVGAGVGLGLGLGPGLRDGVNEQNAGLLLLWLLKLVTKSVPSSFYRGCHTNHHEGIAILTMPLCASSHGGGKRFHVK